MPFVKLSELYMHRFPNVNVNFFSLQVKFNMKALVLSLIAFLVFGCCSAELPKPRGMQSPGQNALFRALSLSSSISEADFPFQFSYASQVRRLL